MVLTALIVIPLLGGLAGLVLGDARPRLARGVAIASAAAVLVLATGLWLAYRPALSNAAPVLEQNVAWIPAIGARYHLALDGLSLVLITLTGYLGLIAIAASLREVTKRFGAYACTLLATVAALNGAFLARDLLLFFLFWELILVPMAFTIGIWGHGHRIQTALKFFLYTFVAGMLLLAAILALYFTRADQVGQASFALADLAGVELSAAAQAWILLGFFLGLGVKLPILGLHGWLPDAHTDAPTGASVMLAGVMLKAGAYGLLRFALPLLPEASSAFAPIAVAIGLAGVIYGAVLAFAQTDFKRLVAYTSVSHMGYVLVGIFAGNALALQGAVLEMVCHGLATGALFVLVGQIQERTGTRDFARLGGLWATVPRMGGFALVFALASLGIPGVGNFIAEVLILFGAYLVRPWWAVVGAIGLVLSMIYALQIMQRVFYGPNRHGWRLPDLSARELAVLGSMALLLFALGLRPQPVFDAARGGLNAAEQALGAGSHTVTDDLARTVGERP